MDTTAVHNSLPSNNMLAASNSFRLMKGNKLNSFIMPRIHNWVGEQNSLSTNEIPWATAWTSVFTD